MTKVPLIVDSNERGPLKDAIVRAAERQGIPIKQEFLQGMGDYKAGDGHIECKSISDLFQSTYSGHLMRQMENLDANCQRVFLVVHGALAKYVKISNNQGRKTTYSKALNTLTGVIARIMADFDCHVWRANNYSEAAMFVTKLHSKLHTSASSHGAKAITRVSTNDIRADMLLSIPGFGQDLVEKLLDKCGSIEEMLHVESIKQVKGMGSVLRQRLIEVLTSEEPVKVERKYSKRREKI